MMARLSRCTVCTSSKVVPACSIQGYAIARCTACAHRFVAQQLDSRVLDEAYDRKYYGGADTDPSVVGYADYLGKAEQRIEGFQTRLRRIARYTDKPGTLLDFGCAVGLGVKAANEEGWQAVGYERSAWAVDYGRRVIGVDIRLGTGESDPFPEASFDAITLWDVIEHVEHPRSIVALVRGWLKVGGIVALNTVNASSLGARLAGTQWRHLTPPHHLQFFGRRALMRLLRDAGFRVLEVTASGTCFEGVEGRSIAPVLQRVENLLGYWRIRPMVTALNLLDEIEVIAVKS